jgi:hypothetical protein
MHVLVCVFDSRQVKVKMDRRILVCVRSDLGHVGLQWKDHDLLILAGASPYSYDFSVTSLRVRASPYSPRKRLKGTARITHLTTFWWAENGCR